MSSDKKVKEVRGIIIFAAIVWLMVMNIQMVFKGVFSFFNILKPFIIGGAIAFVLNIPMKFYERKLFGKVKSKKLQSMARPLSLLLSIVSVGAVVAFVVLTVIPQLGETITQLAVQVPEFFNDVYMKLEKYLESNPELFNQIKGLNLEKMNWQSILGTIGNYLTSGVGSLISSSVNVATSIIGVLINSLIAFIFSIYVLLEKDKLGNQSKRILKAYSKEKIYNKTLNVLSLLCKNFTAFISGQCLEAVILGTMFFVAMIIFRMPYALLVGVLIAFTALIPIVGAFIGCFVGAFLILVDTPQKAIWFLILFFVLQQIEGQLIYPKVVGSSVGLPSIWVLVAVSVGASLFGVPGILLFIPICSTIYVLLRDDVNRRTVEVSGKREELKVKS